MKSVHKNLSVDPKTFWKVKKAMSKRGFVKYQDFINHMLKILEKGKGL